MTVYQSYIKSNELFYDTKISCYFGFVLFKQP